MNPAPPFKAGAVALVYFGSVALLLWGELRSPFGYADPRFVVHYFGTEMQVAALLALCTWRFFSPASIGWRRPARPHWRDLMPLALLFALAFVAWAVARTQSAPLPASRDVAAWQVLRTTLLVGLTEEWVYRGVLLAAFSAWWGLRRGAVAALLLFGALHLMNVVVGQTLLQASLQFVLATLSGATLMLAALATRSLWLPVVAHGVYDFLVFDTARCAPTATTGLLQLALLALGPLIGLYSLVRILRRGDEAPPY